MIWRRSRRASELRSSRGAAGACVRCVGPATGFQKGEREREGRPQVRGKGVGKGGGRGRHPAARQLCTARRPLHTSRGPALVKPRPTVLLWRVASVCAGPQPPGAFTGRENESEQKPPYDAARKACAHAVPGPLLVLPLPPASTAQTCARARHAALAHTGPPPIVPQSIPPPRPANALGTRTQPAQRSPAAPRAPRGPRRNAPLGPRGERSGAPNRRPRGLRRVTQTSAIRLAALPSRAKGPCDSRTHVSTVTSKQWHCVEEPGYPAALGPLRRTAQAAAAPPPPAPAAAAPSAPPRRARRPAAPRAPRARRRTRAPPPPPPPPRTRRRDASA